MRLTGFRDDTGKPKRPKRAGKGKGAGARRRGGPGGGGGGRSRDPNALPVQNAGNGNTIDGNRERPIANRERPPGARGPRPKGARPMRGPRTAQGERQPRDPNAVRPERPMRDPNLIRPERQPRDPNQLVVAPLPSGPIMDDENFGNRIVDDNIGNRIHAPRTPRPNQGPRPDGAPAGRHRNKRNRSPLRRAEPTKPLDPNALPDAAAPEARRGPRPPRRSDPNVDAQGAETPITPSAPERLQKVLARAGYGSRRSLEEEITQGHVVVNGAQAELGMTIKAGDEVEIDGQLLIARDARPQLPRVLIYNKPEGEICTTDDPEGRPTVFEKLPRLKSARWIAIGRLDINTAGLLLFTDSGELAHALMHPSFEVEREYVCRVHGELEPGVTARLTQGVELEDGPAKFDQLEAMNELNSNQWYRVVIKEGRQREVRRMWEAVGVQVSRLKRIRYGEVTLPRGVKRGGFQRIKELPQAWRDSIDLPTLVLDDPTRQPAHLAQTQGLPGNAERPHGASRRRRFKQRKPRLPEA